MAKRRPSAGKPAISWNVSKLVASLGGVETAVDAHRAYGLGPLSYKQVSMWRLRGKVPADRLAELFVVLKHVNGRVDLWDYILRE